MFKTRTITQWLLLPLLTLGFLSFTMIQTENENPKTTTTTKEGEVRVSFDVDISTVYSLVDQRKKGQTDFLDKLAMIPSRVQQSIDCRIFPNGSSELVIQNNGNGLNIPVNHLTPPDDYPEIDKIVVKNGIASLYDIRGKFVEQIEMDISAYTSFIQQAAGNANPVEGLKKVEENGNFAAYVSIDNLTKLVVDTQTNTLVSSALVDERNQLQHLSVYQYDMSKGRTPVLKTINTRYLETSDNSGVQYITNETITLSNLTISGAGNSPR